MISSSLFLMFFLCAFLSLSGATELLFRFNQFERTNKDKTVSQMGSWGHVSNQNPLFKVNSLEEMTPKDRRKNLVVNMGMPELEKTVRTLIADYSPSSLIFSVADPTFSGLNFLQDLELEFPAFLTYDRMDWEGTTIDWTYQGAPGNLETFERLEGESLHFKSTVNTKKTLIYVNMDAHHLSPNLAFGIRGSGSGLIAAACLFQASRQVPDSHLEFLFSSAGASESLVPFLGLEQFLDATPKSELAEIERVIHLDALAGPVTISPLPFAHEWEHMKMEWWSSGKDSLNLRPLGPEFDQYCQELLESFGLPFNPAYLKAWKAYVQRNSRHFLKFHKKSPSWMGVRNELERVQKAESVPIFSSISSRKSVGREAKLYMEAHIREGQAYTFRVYTGRSWLFDICFFVFTLAVVFMCYTGSRLYLGDQSSLLEMATELWESFAEEEVVQEPKKNEEASRENDLRMMRMQQERPGMRKVKKDKRAE